MRPIQETNITPKTNKLLREWFGANFFVVGAYESDRIKILVVLASGHLYVMRYFWMSTGLGGGYWEKSQDEKRPLRDLVKVGMQQQYGTATHRVGFVAGNLFDNMASQLDVMAEREKMQQKMLEEGESDE